MRTPCSILRCKHIIGSVIIAKANSTLKFLGTLPFCPFLCNGNALSQNSPKITKMVTMKDDFLENYWTDFQILNCIVILILSLMKLG